MAQVPLAPQVQDLVHVLSQDILISSVLAHCGTAIQLTSHWDADRYVCSCTYWVLCCEWVLACSPRAVTWPANSMLSACELASLSLAKSNCKMFLRHTQEKLSFSHGIADKSIILWLNFLKYGLLKCCHCCSQGHFWLAQPTYCQSSISAKVVPAL